MDLGYEFIADKNDLFLNDNPDFLKLPIQGFKFSVRIDDPIYQLIENHPNKSKINVAVRKIILSSSNFWISFPKNVDDHHKVDVYCKNNGEIINIANFIKQKVGFETIADLSNNFSEKDNAIHSSESIISSSSMIIAHPLLWEPFSQFIMKVKQVTSPSDFYLKFMSDPDYQKFKSKLQTFMTSNSIKNVDVPIIGHVYGGISDLHRNKYVRVLVLSSTNDANEYNCFEMDKGMETIYKSKQLYELPEELIAFPARSVHASLYGNYCQ